VADLNAGTATPGANDYAAHWTPTIGIQWLLATLNAHPSGLKFACLPLPLYADDSAASEASDPNLHGNSSLEGLLASKGVNLAFSVTRTSHDGKHAATGTGVQSLPSYTTGGGGADVQSISSTCFPERRVRDRLVRHQREPGSRCGAAPSRRRVAQIYHFLKVTVSVPRSR